VGEGERREGENGTEIASRRRGRREEREAGRDREGEADQRRVESREAGSVPFSSSQAPIPLGSVAVALRVSL